jgi:hypothetical protein
MKLSPSRQTSELHTHTHKLWLQTERISLAIRNLTLIQEEWGSCPESYSEQLGVTAAFWTFNWKANYYSVEFSAFFLGLLRQKSEIKQQLPHQNCFFSIYKVFLCRTSVRAVGFEVQIRKSDSRIQVKSITYWVCLFGKTTSVTGILFHTVYLLESAIYLISSTLQSLLRNMLIHILSLYWLFS